MSAPGPTFASVTDTPCSCEYLQCSANDPRLPIIFDPQTNEFHFKYSGPDGKGNGLLVIYHCPFCGGAAPRSKRHLLFAIIPHEEEARLAKLLAPVTTIRKALRHLGKPDQDGPLTSSRQDESDTQPPNIRHHRTLVYEHLSPTADICITERANGHAFWQLQGKYLDSPPIPSTPNNNS